jgi:hypothetical protein
MLADMKYLRFVLGLTLAGCSGQCETSVEHTLGAEQVQTMISTDIAKKLGTAPAAVTCPKEITIGKGKNFDCTFKTAAGLDITAKVEQKDDEGNVRINYAPAIGSPTDIAAALGKTLAEPLGSDVTLDCGSTWQIQGVPFVCGVKAVVDGAAKVGTVKVEWTGETFKYGLEMAPPTEEAEPAEEEAEPAEEEAEPAEEEAEPAEEEAEPAE